MSAWQPIETAPKGGVHFLAYVTDLVDEYDENDRLIRRAAPTKTIVIAYQDALFGMLQYPWNGGIPQKRRYTHWHPLPTPPEATAVGARP